MSTLAFLLSLALAAPPAAGEGVHYERTLRLPSRNDAFGDPRAVHADRHTGEVFVVDSRFHRIAIFDSDGFFKYLIHGGRLWTTPADLAVDPEGRLLLLARREEQRGLLWLDFDGRPLGTVRLGVPEGLAEPAFSSVALSEDAERVFLLDGANQRLWIADRGGTVLKTVDVLDDLEAKEARETVLGRVDVYGETVLVARGTRGDVRLYDLDGALRGWAGFSGTAPCQTAFPTAAALSADGHVVILDRRRMLFTIWQREGNRCLSEHSGIGAALGYVYQPVDLTLDDRGQVVVTQGFKGRVQVFSGAPHS